MTPPPPRPTLFPYTTLFRSSTSTSPNSESTRAPIAETAAASPMSHGQTSTRPPCSPAKPAVSSNASSRSEEHTSELQSHSDLVCRLLLEKKKYLQKDPPQCF